MRQHRCEDCRHFLPLAVDGESECHRWPPKADARGDGGRVPLWPTTYPGQWCGEWAPHPVSNPGNQNPPIGGINGGWADAPAGPGLYECRDGQGEAELVSVEYLGGTDPAFRCFGHAASFAVMPGQKWRPVAVVPRG